MTPTARAHDLIPRGAHARVREQLGDARAVAVIGPRQSGKTTLVRDLVGPGLGAMYVTLDDATTRNAALADPTGFVDATPVPTIVDEVQRAPDLILAIKARLDRDPEPGQYLLTGSANIQMLPTIRDALPGRVEYVHLWPLARAEALRTVGDPIRTWFEDGPPEVEDGPTKPEVARLAAVGGFPGIRDRGDAARARFFESYIDSVVGRDIPDIARTRDAAAVGRLLRLLAARSASLLRYESLAGDLGVDRKTVQRYVSILEELMLVRVHPAWHTNLSSREIRTPKVYVTDTGLQAATIGASVSRILGEPAIAGMVFETYAAMELVRLSSWSAARPRLFHYRDRDGREVDMVLEVPDGRIVGIEVKAAATVSSADLRGLRYLRDRLGERFVRGILLFAGPRSVPFGDRLTAAPMSALWS